MGAPDDLASVTVRHPDRDEPPPQGTPYYVPTTVANTTASAHSLLRAVDSDGKDVVPLKNPHWKLGTDPCENFTFREGNTPGEVDDACVVFVVPDGAELDYLWLTVRLKEERTAWAVAPQGSPPPSPTPSPSPIVRTDDEVCGKEPFKASAVRAYNPNAAAYAGAGIHPIRLFKPDFFDAGGVPPQLPSEWGSADADRIQLVVCEYHDKSFRERTIDTCTYVGGYRPGVDAEVRTARYIYRVFEARTSRLVTTFKLNGTTSVEELCPDETYAPASTYWQRVTSKALEDRLKPLVTGDAPTR
ncbi:hypothetical protein [Micromonospora sp. NPDC006431]|uniref:hypothetical protein n=1 Tax=Micromonospora sp. NPDC006431 TaxID=3364235 RepID=UPI00368FC817